MARKKQKTPMFNTLRFTKKLKSGGFSQQQAETQSEALTAIIHDHLATKTDLEKTESTLRSEIKTVETQLSNKIELLRRDMKLWFGSMLVSAVVFLSALMTTLSFIHH